MVSNMALEGALTDPFKLFSVAVAKLVLQDSQQVSNDIQPLRQQPNPLVHLEIAPHRLVDRFQLRLDPEELGGVEH